MPTPDRTSLDAIVLAAQEILEAEGLGGLSMQAVALRVGVRAPSLYKRVANREELIRLVAEASLAELGRRLDAAQSVDQLADAFRSFGHERPAAFQLMMAPGAGAPVPEVEAAAAASRAILRLANELAGEERALDAARTVTAWAVGFVSMELNSGFNLGGDVESAWRFGIASITDAITAA